MEQPPASIEKGETERIVDLANEKERDEELEAFRRALEMAEKVKPLETAIKNLDPDPDANVRITRIVREPNGELSVHFMRDGVKGVYRSKE